METSKHYFSTFCLISLFLTLFTPVVVGQGPLPEPKENAVLSASAKLESAFGDSTATPFTGAWTYRSFLSNPDLSSPVEDLLFGAGNLVLSQPTIDKISGSLGGTGWSLSLKGSATMGNPPTIRFQGKGIIGGEEWIYDYLGYLVPAWPNGDDQRPAIVGTIVRTAPHSNGQAKPGLVAQWIAVKQDPKQLGTSVRKSLIESGDEPFRYPIMERRLPERALARLALRNINLRAEAPRLVTEPAVTWPVGREITVAFRGGSEEAYREIEEAANVWAYHGNFSFLFKDRTGNYLEWTPSDREYAADIRIGFVGSGPDSGYWSHLGINSRTEFVAPPFEASMNLEGMEGGNLSIDERGTVIHEFGHALGAHHEHQNPSGHCDSEFRWDDDAGYEPTTDVFGQFVEDSQGRRPGLYTILGGPPNEWSKEEVDFNLRQLPNDSAFDTDEHDPLSIMHYSFGAWMFNSPESNCQVTRNNELSEKDIEGIKRAYPEEPGRSQIELLRRVREAVSKSKQLKPMLFLPEE